MPLGLNLESLIAHIVNIVVLYFFLRFLLYKPIKKFMDARESNYKQREEDVATKEEAVAEQKAKYDDQMKDANAEADRIVLGSRKDANSRADDIIDKAKKQANEMIEQAREDIAAERDNAKVAMREEVADLAIGIASSVLEREVSKDENNRIVDSFLNKKRLG